MDIRIILTARIITYRTIRTIILVEQCKTRFANFYVDSSNISVTMWLVTGAPSGTYAKVGAKIDSYDYHK